MAAFKSWVLPKINPIYTYRIYLFFFFFSFFFAFCPATLWQLTLGYQPFKPDSTLGSAPLWFRVLYDNRVFCACQVVMTIERGERPLSPVHVHVDDHVPVHVHVKKPKKPGTGGHPPSSTAVAVQVNCVWHTYQWIHQSCCSTFHRDQVHMQPLTTILKVCFDQTWPRWLLFLYWISKPM